MSCPYGAFGTVSNDTMQNGESFSNSEDGSTDDTVSADLYVKPGANVGFVVTIPEATATQNFTITFTASQCADPDSFPVGSNNQCIGIDKLDIDDTQTVIIGAGVWKYFQITTPTLLTSPNMNSFNITANGTKDGVDMYIQKDYIPLEAWYMNADMFVDDDETTAMILTPGYQDKPDVYYVGLYNTNDAAKQITISTKNQTCAYGNSTTYGYDCKHISSNVTSNGGVFQYSANIVNNATVNNGEINNGSSLSFRLTDSSYDHDYAYFRLVNYPIYNNGNYFVRVSIGNNDVTDLSGAPPAFAKLGGLPSEASNHYNLSSYGDVVHQFSLPITTAIFTCAGGGRPSDQPCIPPPESSWYIAVKLPADFSIWVGANCADDCDQQEHGDCWCSGHKCTVNVTSQAQTYNDFYILPKNASDSAGACSCTKDKYDFSFDCSQKNNGNSALYILLIAIGGLIVLGVAIGVPIYCYIANKKSKVVDDL